MSYSSPGSTEYSLLIVQPYLTQYRLPVFSHLASVFRVTVLGSRTDQYGEEFASGALKIELVDEFSILGVLFWQRGLARIVARSNIQLLFVTANPRYLSTWIALLVARIRGIKVCLHGQGLYRKPRISIINRLVYFFYNWLSDRYVAYTELSAESLRELSIARKVVVAENSIDNAFPISAKTGKERGVLFVGRLRDGSNIEMLIQVCIRINEGYVNLEDQIDLHIVGGGATLQSLRKKYEGYTFIRFWGEIYDGHAISEISRSCFAGCYPGDAGLSVLHYMSLSLVPIVHSSLHLHMGPEPSYVVDEESGVTFERNDPLSLQHVIGELMDNRERLKRLQRAAYERSAELTNPSLGERLKNTLAEVVVL